MNPISAEESDHLTTAMAWIKMSRRERDKAIQRLFSSGRITVDGQLRIIAAPETSTTLDVTREAP